MKQSVKFIFLMVSFHTDVITSCRPVRHHIGVPCLTDWLTLFAQSDITNYSEIENYNVQDRKSELTDSCPKDKYRFKLRITNNTNTKKLLNG